MDAPSPCMGSTFFIVVIILLVLAPLSLSLYIYMIAGALISRIGMEGTGRMHLSTDFRHFAQPYMSLK
jgi:hypothetical protein